MIYLSIIMLITYMFILIWLTSGMIKNNHITDETFHPEASIIISAHNEESNLELLLNILINQNYNSKYEIIIANDRSSDNTQMIIDTYSNEYRNIHGITINETPVGWGHKKWALNKCIESTQYNIILQTDADCIPGKNWLKSMINHFSNPNVVFVSGPAPMSNKNNPFTTYYELDSLAQDALSASALSQNIAFSCTGRNMGFLRQTFLDINGYDDIQHYQSGDDDLLLQKFATQSTGIMKFSFDADSTIVSDPPQSLRVFLNQRIRYASKGFEYYKLDTTLEFKLFLPFLYLTNLICLLGIVFFIQMIEIIYLLPLLMKILSDYWICSNFYYKINKKFLIKEFFILSLIHPIYVVSLGIISPFLKYNWKNDD